MSHLFCRSVRETLGCIGYDTETEIYFIASEKRLNFGMPCIAVRDVAKGIGISACSLNWLVFDSWTIPRA